MGSFANIVFSILLGWFKTLCSMIWHSATAKDGQSILTFLGDHWMIIAMILCLIGLIADFAVYLHRWKPYRSLQHEEMKEETADVLPDSPAAELQSDTQTEETGYHQPWNRNEEKPTPVYFQNAETQNRRRRIRVSGLFGGEEENPFYFRENHQPLIDQKEAYHEPVYPKNWRKSEERES